MKNDLHKFEKSNYPTDNRYDIPQANKKIVGLTKDENPGILMIEFAGLETKMYSFAVEGGIQIIILKRKEYRAR